MKSILILGGTGAMGVYLVNLISDMGGVKCTVTTRKCHKNLGNVEYVQGDAQDDTFLYPLLESRHWDAVVDFMCYPTDVFAKRLPRLLDATDQLVYLSSSRVYADSTAPITEDSPRLLDVCQDADYLATDEYALAKARQENLLRQSGRKNWTIIRPYVTFSEYRLQLSSLEKEYWLQRSLSGKTIVFSKNLADKLTTLTFGEDVARGIAAILGQEKALGEAFHITCSQSYRWSELLQAYLDAIEEKVGKRPKVLLTDHWQQVMGGGAMQVKYDRLYDRVFDNSKISQFIDTTTFSDTKESLKHCVKSFIDQPSFLFTDWTSEARKDVLTGDWTSLSQIPGWKMKAKYLLIRLRLHK